MTRPPFWSDDFDMDLLRVIPEAEAIIAPIAGAPLWTHGHLDLTRGRLNHPTVWNWDGGVFAYFGTRPTGFKPDVFDTDAPIVECTVLEAFRDAWVHSYLIVVDGRRAWDVDSLVFERLMYHRRGWRARPRREADGLVARARGSLRWGVKRMAEVLRG